MAQEQGVLQNTKVDANKTARTGINAMHANRASSLNQVLGQQQKTSSTDTAQRTKIAGEINKIYTKTKTDVEKILSDLDTQVSKQFAAGTALAKRKFENYNSATN